MSSSSQQKITCPNCKRTSKFRIWGSINTTLNPEMKQAVRDGSAFLFTCPYCNEATHVEYGFLYHQMEDRIMIHVAATDEEVASTLKMLAGDNMTDVKKTLQEGNFLIRIVVSQNALREKLAIFDSGLDDRIIELYKVFLLEHCQNNHPDADRISLLYYQGDAENSAGIQVFADGKPANAFKFSAEMYQQVSDAFLTSLKDIREEQPIVDQQWAFQFFHDHFEEN